MLSSLRLLCKLFTLFFTLSFPLPANLSLVEYFFSLFSKTTASYFRCSCWLDFCLLRSSMHNYVLVSFAFADNHRPLAWRRKYRCQSSWTCHQLFLHCLLSSFFTRLFQLIFRLRFVRVGSPTGPS